MKAPIKWMALRSFNFRRKKNDWKLKILVISILLETLPLQLQISFSSAVLHFPDYAMFIAGNSEKKGGRVTLLFKVNKNGKVIQKITTNSYQTFSVEVSVGGQKFSVAKLYDPPQIKTEHFADQIWLHLIKVKISTNKHAVCGDFKVKFEKKQQIKQSERNLKRRQCCWK